MPAKPHRDAVSLLGVPSRLLTSTLAVAFIAASAGALADPRTDLGVTPEAFTFDRPRVASTEFKGDLRFLPKAASEMESRERYDRRLLLINQNRTDAPPTKSPLAQSVPGPSVPMPAPLTNFPGITRTDSCTGGQCGAGIPPDTNGDVGLNHYVEAVNNAFGIYSKSGTKLAAFTEDQLWSAAGASVCNGNSQGDPVSGGWFFYPLRMDPGGAGLPPVGALNDYAKFGIWSDCVYMSANEFHFPGENFIGVLFASFSRTEMYAGNPLTWAVGMLGNSTGPFTLLPSNPSGRAGSTLPPGTPNYYVSESTTAFAYEVRKFIPGTNCGGGGFLAAPVMVDQATYDFNLPNASQPNTSNTLDSLGDRLMQKAQFRKIGNKESIWAVHAVTALYCRATRFCAQRSAVVHSMNSNGVNTAGAKAHGVVAAIFS